MNITFSYILGYIFSIFCRDLVELNNIAVHITYSLLPIPELILYGSRGMASEAGNSVSSTSKRIAPPKLCKDVPYRSWEK